MNPQLPTICISSFLSVDIFICFPLTIPAVRPLLLWRPGVLGPGWTVPGVLLSTRLPPVQGTSLRWDAQGATESRRFRSRSFHRLWKDVEVEAETLGSPGKASDFQGCQGGSKMVVDVFCAGINFFFFEQFYLLTKHNSKPTEFKM